jgi:ABC-type uncharacterized transport system ATPase component
LLLDEHTAALDPKKSGVNWAGSRSFDCRTKLA